MVLDEMLRVQLLQFILKEKEPTVYLLLLAFKVYIYTSIHRATLAFSWSHVCRHPSSQSNIYYVMFSRYWTLKQTQECGAISVFY